ncbi:YchJ family protein [Xenorhabdus bovienii]|uniref:YchJ family protein n=1 Tax=Xenorhabdus bovienii TaxID=40576 RepID=UPI00237C7BAE|nr:YchJ family protein [Xenorhabdus bovienii]MDE1485300.1 YchJ family protein [Xenorhabdus bovienii]MDE1493629.1 YchJ family protein [Xenorhabdus bovienii]MDE9471399.1 YchJ family protein [Xenorhabdus bovienii]MDE9476041.1 YchJ family protein [Xenorhabdus bovienii]MDE9528933.1 YchJ family protein [Xenorhabdus bovienii]
MTKICPCGSDSLFVHCCGPYLENHHSAPDAESLMRSRYSAYATKNADYLIATWHPDCQAESWRSEIEQSFACVQWLGLNVIGTVEGQHNNESYVEFSVCFIEQGKQDRQLIHERSRFLRIDQHWFYLDGIRPQTGRNSPCPCGSGKKYKKCCG